MTYLVTAWSTSRILAGVEQAVSTMAELQRLVDTLASKPHIAYIAIRIIRLPPTNQITLDLRA